MPICKLRAEQIINLNDSERYPVVRRLADCGWDTDGRKRFKTIIIRRLTK